MRSRDYKTHTVLPLILRNECYGGCHPRAHCEWGICECNEGFVKMWGRCTKSNDNDAQPTVISKTGNQRSGFVLRLELDFVFPLSHAQQEEPPTKFIRRNCTGLEFVT